jgi:hypothetical protein
MKIYMGTSEFDARVLGHTPGGVNWNERGYVVFYPEEYLLEGPGGETITMLCMEEGCSKPEGWTLYSVDWSLLQGLADDHHVTLGVLPGASQAEIKSAFRRLAARHHPDKGGDPEQFKRIRRAYEALMRNVKCYEAPL